MVGDSEPLWARRVRLGVLYAYTVGQGETGVAAMTFGLILGFWLIGKSIYLIVS